MIAGRTGVLVQHRPCISHRIGVIAIVVPHFGGGPARPSLSKSVGRGCSQQPRPEGKTMTRKGQERIARCYASRRIWIRTSREGLSGVKQYRDRWAPVSKTASRPPSNDTAVFPAIVRDSNFRLGTTRPK